MKKWVLMLVFCLFFNAHADELPLCGTNCTYSLVQNGTDKNNEPTYTLIMEPIDQNQEASTLGSATCTGGCHNTSLWANSNVTKVEFKEGITKIGGSTLEFMPTVTEITLPQGLKEVGQEAFYGVRITNIDIPNTVTSIGSWAFIISTLQSVNLPQNLTSIGDIAFANSSLTEVVIPESVTTLSNSAFGYNNPSWKSAAIKNLYCSEALKSQCKAAVQWKKDLGQTINVIAYQKYGDEYYVDGRFYEKPQDIGTKNHIKKRIYTIEEANRVAGEKNRVSIKYR